MENPQAQSESVFSQWVDGELVVFDQVANVAHCLSENAARAFLSATGARSAAQVAEAESLTLEQVNTALSELADAGLLQGAAQARPVTRRQFGSRATKLAAGVAAAVPLIYSVAIPATAAAMGSVTACDDHSCSARGTMYSSTVHNANEVCGAACPGYTVTSDMMPGTVFCDGIITETRSAGGASVVTVKGHCKAYA